MLTDPIKLLIYLPLSILAFIVSFYFPGRVLIRRFGRYSGIENFVVATCFGVVVWILFSLLIGYLDLRTLSYLYVLSFFIVWMRDWRSEFIILKTFVQEIMNDKWLILIMAIGIPIATSSMITSGLPLKDGIGFYAVNSIDGSYHIALARSITRQIPPIEPGLSGVEVSNYHYLFDVMISEIYRVFKLPIFNLYYHFIPIFMAFIYGLGAYACAKTLVKDKNAGRFFAFFIYFAGSIGYLFMFVFTGKLDFTVNSLDDSVNVFVNPQRVLAQTVFLAGIISLTKWLSTKRLSHGIILAILFGTLVGIKVYVGIFASLGLMLLGIIFASKRQFKSIIPILLTGLISILIYYPVNKNAGGLVYVPFAWPHHFFAEGTAGLLMWQHQMDVFVAHSNKLRIFLLNMQMATSFILIIFGTRILGLFGVLVAWRNIKRPLWVFLTIPSAVFVVISIFFIQESGVFDVFNFIAVSTLIGSLYASIFLSEMLKIGKGSKSVKKSFAIIGFVIIVLFLSVPKSLKEAARYVNLLKLRSGFIVDRSDMEMFGALEGSPDGLVLVDPVDQLSMYTPYLSAFTGKYMYFSGKGILNAHGLYPDARNAKVFEIFAESDSVELAKKLREEEITYVYLVKPYSGIFDKLEHSKIYENEKNLLLKVL